MGLVDDDGEAAAALPAPYLVQDERELLDGGDDDLLARLDELAQVSGGLGMADDGGDLGEPPDGVADLPVQDPPVRHDDDGVDGRVSVLLKTYEPVGEPGDGVGLAAARRVLHKVAPPDSPLRDGSQELADDLELVKSRPYLLAAAASGPPVLGLDDLGVVLDDVGEAVAGEHLLPQVVGLQAVRVRRVARGVVPATVEGQEPRRFALQMGAEADLVVVDGEVDEAAPELEQFFLRVAVAPVLLNRVGHRLLGEAVLELEGGDGQAVDEEAEVEGKLGVVAAVAELARDAEPVQVVEGRCLLVAGRGGAVEEVEVVGAVVDAASQHLDSAAPRDLALEAGEELPARGAVLVEV